MSNVPPPPPSGGGFPPPPEEAGGFTPPPPPAGGFTPPAQGGYTQYGQQPGGYGQKASFGARLGAYLIDWLITSAMLIPGYVVLIAGPKHEVDCGGITDNQFAVCEGPTGGTWAIALLLWLIALIATVMYFAKLDGQGATIGKRSLNIRVVDETTGQPIGTGRGVGRYFAKILSGFLCGLGYLWMLWDDQQQTWHDKIVSTVVVRD